VEVLQWRGCLSAIEYGDSGAVESLRDEADELPCCESDGQAEAASKNSFLSPPRRGRRSILLLHLQPPDPPKPALFMEILISLRRHTFGSDRRSSMRSRKKTLRC
jgi:hypothetical protein